MTDKGSKGISLPKAELISGTLFDLAKKYKAAADVGLRPVTPEKVAEDIARLSAEVKARGAITVPDAEYIAGTLDALGKKYKAAAEMDLRAPAAEVISGTLDDVAKKYKSPS